MPTFTLHPRLAADCLLVQQLPLCDLLMMNDASYPWFILVPRRNHVSEIIDLNLSDQLQLWQESRCLSEVLRTLFAPDKLNVATIGNLVPQLHMHHVCRFQTDTTWPAPVWGKHPAIPYSVVDAEERMSVLRNALNFVLAQNS